MKILSAEQIKTCDLYTIQSEPINSIDLMERAANKFCNWYVNLFPLSEKPMVSILCGKGNNGGDGLAIARILKSKGYDAEVFIFETFSSSSESFNTNLSRIQAEGTIKTTKIHHAEDLPIFDENEVDEKIHRFTNFTSFV